MATDYSLGRYKVFQGRMPGQLPIGRIDEDEYVRTAENKLIYRVDGDKFYDMNGNYLGEIQETDGGRAMVVSGNNCLFVIVPE